MVNVWFGDYFVGAFQEPDRIPQEEALNAVSDEYAAWIGANYQRSKTIDPTGYPCQFAVWLTQHGWCDATERIEWWAGHPPDHRLPVENSTEAAAG